MRTAIDISVDLSLGVGSDMPLVFVFVVCGVTVVDAAAVVTHTRDGHAVGVAEHRCHGHQYTRLTWLPSVKCDDS